MSSYKTYFGTISVKDPTFGAVGNGSTDDTAAIQAALDFAFGGGQGNPFANFEVYFPPGNYVITSPLNITDTLGGHIFGAGNGTTQLFYTGSGAQGNSLSTDYPNFTPIFMLDGVAYTIFENMSLARSHNTIPNTVTLVTSAGTASGATLTFASVPATITAGMLVFNKIAPSSIGNVYVASKTATTVVLSAAVSSAVGNGDTIYFCTSVMGTYLLQSGNNGTTSAITFRNMNFTDFAIGIFAGGINTANCENCSVYDAQFNTCPYAGIRIFGQNTLNWEVYGGGASQCGTLSTFISGTNQGNGSAAYSVTTGGITVLSNCSISGGTTGVDIYLNSCQTMAVVGGRSETLTPIIVDGAAIKLEAWQWGPTTSTGCTVFDLTFSGVAQLDSCILSPSISGGTVLLAAMGNQGILDLNNTLFQANANQLVLSGASNSRFYLRGAFDGGSAPAAATLFGSYTGTVFEYEPIKNIAVGSLPTANAKYIGLKGFVTDSSVTTFNSTAVATGSSKVPVFCNGTNWVIG